MKSGFLDRLHSDDRPVLVFDGAMGKNLEAISYYRNTPLKQTKYDEKR